jgi:hypothetical protein
MASVRKDEGDECVIHGWYNPSDDRPLGNVCVAERCGLPAAFHLCPKHALPGTIVEVGNPGKKFVIICWLVKRNGKRHILTMNDFELGTCFGNRENFEEQLASQGYSILHFVSKEEDVPTFRLEYPGLTACLWIPD